MRNSNRTFTAAALAAAIILSLPSAAEAATIQYDVPLTMLGGWLNPVSVTPGTKNPVIDATTGSGTMIYDDAAQTLSFDIQVSGTMTGDWYIGSGTGTVSGSLSFTWHNVFQETTKSGTWLLGAADGSGTGTFELSINGFHDTVTFDLMPKGAPLGGLSLPEPAFIFFNPLTGNPGELNAWLASANFTLDLGPGRRGLYYFNGDLCIHPDVGVPVTPPPPGEIPEPATTALLLAGMLPAGLIRRRRRT